MLRSKAGDDNARVAAVLAGVRTYQQAPRAASRAPEIIAVAGRARLIGFGGAGRPVVFVPSLINGPEILDLDADRSLMRWLAARGLRPMLVDWGTPDADERGLDIAGHVQRLLLPLLAGLGEPPLIVGYCLGGTMAIVAAALIPTRGLVTIAAPWRFAGYPAETRAEMDDLWQASSASASAAGLMPIEVLQAGFWQLDPDRTLDKYAQLSAQADDPAAVARFVGVEDWANGGPPLTFGAARDLFDDMLGVDLPGNGRWRIDGRTIDPAALGVAMLEVVSETDRIVPAATASGIGERLSLSLGHVGMIVGGSAKARLWEPLAAWIEGRS